MKLYHILKTEAVECNLYCAILFSTTNKDKAIEELGKIANDVKNYDYASEIANGWAVEESETEFTIYEDGYYSTNHYELTIVESDLVS